MCIRDRACEEVVSSKKDWVVWSRTRPKPTEEKESAFVAVGRAVFEGKARAAPSKGKAEGAEELSDEEMEDEQANDDGTRGRACRQRGWWKTGNVAASACSVGMTAWVHQDCTMVDQATIESLQQAWECTEEKDECLVEPVGLERDYWLGSEAGRVGSYEFQGAVFGIDGSNHKGCMGSGCCRLKMPEADQQIRVGREEEGTSSNRPELGGVVLALRQAELSDDVLILCDNESVLKAVKKWVGQGGRATLADAPDADILREILELLRMRIEAGRATFFVKVKSHRGEPLNERADTLAEKGRARPEDEKRWNERTDRMTFTITQQGNSKTSVWTDSVRNAFRKQAGQSKTQDVYEQAARNWSRRVWYPWNQRWMQPTRAGRAAAKNGKFKDEQTWGKECFEDLESRELGEPATTSWSTDFLVRVGESREELGKWLKNRAVPWKRRRRLIQVVTDTFPCGGWLHKIGRRATAECELCRRIKESSEGGVQGAVPTESIGHIQSAGCAGQSEAVTAAHNQYKSLLSGLQAVGQQKGWKVEQLVFVGGTCGSVNVETFNQNLKLLEVPEGKWSRLRQRMARRLLEEQDTVLRAYFAQKYDKTPTCEGGGCNAAGPKGLAHLSRDVYA